MPVNVKEVSGKHWTVPGNGREVPRKVWVEIGKVWLELEKVWTVPGKVWTIKEVWMVPWRTRQCLIGLGSA